MPDAAKAVAARYGHGPLLGAILIAGTWHLFADLVGTMVGWSQYRAPAIVAIAWLTYTLVGVVAAVRLLRRAKPGLVLPLIGVLLLLAASAAQSAACRPEQTFSVAHWSWPNFGWFAMLVVWRLPIVWLFAAMSSEVLLTLVTLVVTRDLDRVDLARYFTSVYGAGAIEFGVAWGARVLESRAGSAARAASERAEITTARAAADAVHADRQRRYEEIGQSLRELLAGLSNEELLPNAPDVQHRCSVEGSRLRRLIAEHEDVPSQLVHELRACADMAERRGVSVSVDFAGAPPDVPLRARRAITDASTHLLAAARRQARVTVWASADTEVEVSVVADADLSGIPHQGDPSVETRWDYEGGAVWLRMRWHIQ